MAVTQVSRVEATSPILIPQQLLLVHPHPMVLRHNLLKAGYMPTAAPLHQLLPLHLLLCSFHRRTSPLLLLRYNLNILPLHQFTITA